MKAAGEWQSWSVSIDRLLEVEDTVVVEGRYDAIYKPTGRKLDAQVCHIWRIKNGKITSFHQYVDTARVRKVMASDATPDS